MKKSMAVILCMIILFPVVAFAEIDISGLSFNELVALKEQILSELLDRGELKEIIVPSGDYIVGEHIPAGEYSVSVVKGNILAMLTINEYEKLYTLTEDSNDIGRLVLKDGDVVSIVNSVIFTKFVGLGF